MLRGTRAIYFLVLLATLIVEHAHSYPYQLLPSIPGYIPVYIRNGDQPLEEINPALAEAFHEHSSLSKSIRLDRNLDATEESRTNSVIHGSQKKYYPAHAREPGNAIIVSERHEDDETNVEKGPGYQVPKLVSLYELHEKLKKKSQDEENERTSSVPKETPAKADRIDSTEKDNLSKDETKGNDWYDLNPNYPELPADIGHHRDTSQDFVSVIGLDALTEQPNVRQYKDVSHLTDERNALDDKNEKKEEEPVKVQRPSDILSNVQKLSPIAPPEAAEKEKSEERAEIKTEIEVGNTSLQEPAVLYYKDLSGLSGDEKVVESVNKKEEESTKEAINEEHSSDVKDKVLKETATEHQGSNVLKLSPIAPPEAYASEDKSTKDKVEEKKPIETSLVHEPIQEPMVHLYKDLFHFTDDRSDAKVSSTAAKEDTDKPVKVESYVVKLAPIAPPEAYSTGNQEAVGPEAMLVQGIVQDDQSTKDMTDRNDDLST